LHSPKEKNLGRASRRQQPPELALRGIDLNSVRSLHPLSSMNRTASASASHPIFSMTRVERITLDEPTGSIPSMDDFSHAKSPR